VPRDDAGPVARCACGACHRDRETCDCDTEVRARPGAGPYLSSNSTVINDKQLDVNGFVHGYSLSINLDTGD